jgi:hypothetical protein
MNVTQTTSMELERRLSSEKLLLVGVARDCGAIIESEVRRLLAALDFFKSVAWLVIESDSADDTLHALDRLKATIPNFRFSSLGQLREEIPSRTERIAHCRNQYLEELHYNPIYEGINYIAIADLDGVNSLITSTAVQSCWVRDGWDVCCANQVGPYYDIWALRHKDWSPNDCWKQYEFLRQFNKSHEAAGASVWFKMITIQENNSWIEVDSAFGGFAIYRRSVLSKELAYLGASELGEEVSEHVSFHNQIRGNGGRIFINPRLINGAENEHTKYARTLSTPESKTLRKLVVSGLKAVLGANAYNAIRSYSRVTSSLPFF